MRRAFARAGEGSVRRVMERLAADHTSGRYTGQVAVDANRDSLRRLADATPDIAWLSDADGTLRYVNERFREYAGTELDAALCDPASGVIHIDDYQPMLAAWNAAAQSGHVVEVHFRLRRASDGRYRWQR